MTRVCFDYDPILYTAAAIGETRSVKIVHRESGDEYEFPTRTAFYGHWKKKAGGWLAEYNKAKTTQRTADEFDYFDIQTPEPIEHCMHTARKVIESVKEAVGASSYYGYSGKGQVFRVDVSTIMKYKGNRDDVMRPVHLDALKDYLVKRHGCKIIEKIEADDACSMDSYEAYAKWKKSQSDKDKLILAAVDKDYLQCPAHLIHPYDLGKVDSHDGSFGFLQLETKGAQELVKGRGRMWLYHQVMSGDDADFYCANSASDMKWGPKSSYKLLEGAKTDKEAFEALVEGYKTLYPQPKKIIGWRGYEDAKRTILKPNASEFEIEIDWLYVMQENFSLAMMLRKPGDKIDVKATLDKLGVKY